MTEAQLATLTTQLLAAAFVLGMLFGAVAQRSHFCTMGAVADVVNTGDFGRLRMWALAIGVAVIGFNGMVALGWVQAADSIYAGPRVMWLSAAAGGVLFGFGMVLASGCGSKTLVRIGGGSLKSLVVFSVLGLTAYATMRGVFAVGRVATVDTVAVSLPAAQDLPSLLAWATGWPLERAAAVAGLLVGGLLVAWVLLRPEGRSLEVLTGGLGIGLIVVAAWWVSGVLGHIDEHPVTLEETFVATSTRNMESLTFVAPIAYSLDWIILFSDSSKRLSMAVMSVFGVIAGSAVYALATRSFRWEGLSGTEDTANHLVGGALMGIGGVTAMGCTVGQGLSGISTLSLGSAIALAGILGGAWAGVRYQAWRVERML
ncbi:MAG: YeeE/YedE family protein [Rubrivivax sp.]|nr:YeeE/YedE family protein [Rubrivivax sp.]